MGEIRNIQCGACGSKWQCMEGSGLLYGKKENIIAAFSERERAAVTAQIAGSGIPAYDFEFQPAVCSHCRNIVSVPVLVTGENETYVGVCPVCGGKVKRPVSQLEETDCPVCKCRALRTELYGEWD